MLCRPKLIPHRVFGIDLIAHAEAGLDPVLQPQQHGAEGQAVGVHRVQSLPATKSSSFLIRRG